ncbi:MAG TPA: helix-turn-helix transcriptional regulator [Terriglobia bacterium]|nr:helix-turn-helix transcriptional regulator [Terriglobia bacterium]
MVVYGLAGIAGGAVTPLTWRWAPRRTSACVWEETWSCDDGEDVRVRFGHRLQKLRRQHGWTQVQLAERLGLDRSYLADVERGKRNISIVNLEIIARGFGLSLSRLLITV